ncbi:MAG TPA: alpha/beta hydrolase [bacterium]|jgi:pimeloyl-ACP methyl ester carboxylesterase|nr:alpha/beta hydrolase [bacterium]
MNFYDFNPGSEKPLVHLAHANGFPPQTYQKALQALFPHYHVVSFPARPLWGDTPPEWLKDWSQLSDDLLEGLRSFENQKIIGIGHSLGGVLTLYAAVKQPDRFSRIILIDPTMLAPKLLWQIKLMKLFGLESRSYLIKGALRRKRTWENREEAYQHFRSRGLFKNWSDEVVTAYTDSMTGPSPTGGVHLIYPPEWEAQIYRTIPTDIWKFAAMLQQPTLVIRGETSNTFTTDSEKAFRKANLGAIFEVVQGAGHLVPQERPEEVGGLLMDFIEKNLERLWPGFC